MCSLFAAGWVQNGQAMLPRPPFVPLMRAFLTALYIPTLLWTGGPAMRAQAQAALDLPRETFTVADRPAFVMLPAPEKRTAPQPWVFYAPTLPAYPDEAERWMHERFLEAGIAIAGVDVGEAYGSPERSHPAFAALYENLIAQRGFASKPCLLGRSRGGLWVSSWALAHPEKAAGLAGIYPVFDLRSYPKLEAAAPAYGLTPAELENRLSEFNPVARLAQLARARLPAFLISGDQDTVVPLEANSAEFARHYKEAGVGDLVTLVVIKGQGHNFFEGFFKSQELVDFAIARARAGAKPASPNKTPAPSPGVR
jgi:dipeptidyl aminopeptidase/acylaminoacyl peptidase